MTGGLATPAAWVTAAVCLGLAAWLARRPRELSLGRLVSSVVLLGVALGLWAPAAVGLLGRLGYVTRGVQAVDGGGAVMAVLLGIAWVALALWLVLGPARRLRDARWLWLVAGALLVARLAFVTVAVMEPGDDFAKMWAQAGELAERFELPPVPTSPDDDHAAVIRAYFERSLPFFWPLQEVFGGGVMVYRVANALVVVATSLLLFFLTRGWFGSGPARATFVASQMAPETWVAQLLPTHDIPGTFLTLAAIALAVLLWKVSTDAGDGPGRWLRIAGLAAGLAVVLEVLDLQRTNAAPLVLAWLLVALGTGIARRGTEGVRWPRVLVVALLPVVGFVALEATLLQVGLLRDPAIQKERKMKKIAAYTDSWGSGSSNHWKGDWVRRDMEDGDWGHLARRKLLTDTVLHPFDRVAHAARKADDLYDLGNQTHFYIRGGELPVLGEVSRSDERRYRQANAVYVVAFLGLVLLGMVAAWREAGTLRIELLPMVYLAILSGVLVYTFETQPRYVFQVWSLGAVYVGLPIAGAGRLGEPDGGAP